MAKLECIKTEGWITRADGNARFEVELPQGNKINCTISGKMRQNYIRVLVGDHVEIEISPYDLTRGRISKRLKK